MFDEKTAAKLDTAAGALHRAGKKLAGDKGGRVGDAIATVVLGGLRARCNCCDKDVCSHA